MTEEELKQLDKTVKKLKRLATDVASEIHDLVEDRYLAEYKQLPMLAQKAVAACEQWAEAKTKYDEASNAVA